MIPALAKATFALALLFYSASSVLFFQDVARHRGGPGGPRSLGKEALSDGGSKGPLGRIDAAPARSLAPLLLGLGAMSHGAYVSIASFVAHVCPVHSVHFLLSVASLLAAGVYLIARRRFRIEALGILVGPLGLAFLMGTYFLGEPDPGPKLSPLFIAAHVLANLLGVALFLLAGGAAALYLVQEKRLKQKRPAGRIANLPPLDTLDHAEHRFLVAGFPLLTLGILTGTFWARHLEMGSMDTVMRMVLSYATWLLIALVLLLRAAAGWRGRRAAYGTIAGLACAAAVIVLYLVRPEVAGRLGG
jgi:ABC-type uncharacterized transport system permease subunit